MMRSGFPWRCDLLIGERVLTYAPSRAPVTCFVRILGPLDDLPARALGGDPDGVVLARQLYGGLPIDRFGSVWVDGDGPGADVGDDVDLASNARRARQVDAESSIAPNPVVVSSGRAGGDQIQDLQ